MNIILKINLNIDCHSSYQAGFDQILIHCNNAQVAMAQSQFSISQSQRLSQTTDISK